MEQRRFTLFVVVSSLIIFGWFFLLGPLLFPNQFKPAPPPNPPAGAAGEDAPDEDGPDGPPAEEGPAIAGDLEEPAAAGDPQPEDADSVVLDDFPSREIILGSMDRDSGYFFEVEATSRGAAIETITLNDERYVAEGRRGAPPEQLKIVGNDPLADNRTFDTGVARIDAFLRRHGASLRDVDWEVDRDFIDQHTDADTGIVRGVRFSYPSEEVARTWGVRVFKTFEVHRSAPEQRDQDADGYLIDFSIQIENLTDAPLAAAYELAGPVGLPLENVENTRTFIEVKAGITEDPDAPFKVTDTDERTAAAIVDAVKNNELEPWRAPLRYIGVDVQFFAALVVPRANQQADRTLDAALPFVVLEHVNEKQRSDVSVLLTSTELTIPPRDTVEHQYQLFAGPKRGELLDAIDAGGVINYGWFGTISVWMVNLLEFFHHFLKLPYGLAIVFLTLIVRACMFPITRKQAKGAKKMKELQPELTKLKEKYGKEPEKFWQAQRDLFRKHNYHPMAGCLPLFLQMPIFFGLYSALNMAVDLRMVNFLWIDNLAAPDALFPLPFTIPFLGWTEFNLLPLVTIALWIVQQKMFMPPAASEEQALQHKMMTYMMVFFGFMIYRVPAGLCVYFITSTLWGLTERKLLDFAKPDDEKKTDIIPAFEAKPSREQDEAPSAEPKPPGFFQRLLDAADQARQQTNGQRPSSPAPDRKGASKPGGGGRRRKSRR